MKPKLISFKLCPFVQKAVLTLLTKGVEFDIEYIDLENPPAWFSEISPLGKVPVLQVGDKVLFESSVIIEYLDEVHGQSLHPSDPLTKAQNRSWMEFGNECLMNGYQILIQSDEKDYNQKRNALLDKMDLLENQLADSSFFNGEMISLVDLSFIPFFQRQAYLNEIHPGFIDEAKHPRLTSWSKKLLALDIVAASTVDNIKPIYWDFMKSRNGYLSTLMN